MARLPKNESKRPHPLPTVHCTAGCSGWWHHPVRRFNSEVFLASVLLCFCWQMGSTEKEVRILWLAHHIGRSSLIGCSWFMFMCSRYIQGANSPSLLSFMCCRVKDLWIKDHPCLLTPSSSPHCGWNNKAYWIATPQSSYNIFIIQWNLCVKWIIHCIKTDDEQSTKLYALVKEPTTVCVPDGIDGYISFIQIANVKYFCFICLVVPCLCCPG